MWPLLSVTIGAFVLSLIATPLVRRVAVRYRLVDSPDLSRKLHARSVPRVGGAAVVISYALALAGFLLLSGDHTQVNMPRALERMGALAPAAILVFLTGLLDDTAGLKAWQKLVLQTLASGWAFAQGFGIRVLAESPAGVYVSLLLTVGWLVACCNALNLIDGIDGLAAGIGFIASAATLAAALVHHNPGLALLAAPLAGSLLGFLKYNFNPASIFLGDCGSLLVGFLLGCYGILWSQRSATAVGFAAPMIALAVPLLDVVLAIVRRSLGRRSIFEADRGHIHHRLLDRGYTPRRAALLLYAFSGLSAGLALLQDVTHDRFGGLFPVLICAAAWFGLQHMRYFDFGPAVRSLFRGGWKSRPLPGRARGAQGAR
jgi:UDP-GlcNAc:undecaprenyl-phosphate GlcNAc-1-phosphate transferase